ncbi:MAG TPA: amidohydrolase [Solirubrobacteraceae bacterium]|jgi:predicted amidohydrolase YtcJ|nr:amidohydrolase [Solirubrobacteraceae bacterium]
MTEHADIVIVGADVRTMNPRAPRAEAVAARGRQIVALGSTAEIESLRGPATVVVDARGATVLPGLIDAHGHFGHVARSMATAVDCRTPPVTSVANILARAGERVQTVAPGTWILLQGTTFQDELLAERRFPTPQELSEVSHDRPIVYRSSIHNVVVNRCALELAGIDRDTPEPAGARIERDAEGEPTGVLAEMFDRFPIPQPTDTELAGSISNVAWGHYLANGVTSIQEIWDSAQVMRLLGGAVCAGEIPLRVRGFGWVPLAGSLEEVASGAIADVPLRADWFEGSGVKLFVDGGTSSHTAAFYEEYLDAPGKRGALTYELGELTDCIRDSFAAGAQVALHAAGDLAQDIALAAFELAGARAGDGRRPRIEHGANTAWSERRTAWCKRAGVLPVPNLGFIYNYGEFWPRALGEQRSHECVPLRTLLGEGFEVPGTSDTTGGDPRLLDPFHNMWCAITRRTFAGRTIDPDQRITREQALTMYTRFAAHAGFWEDSRGALQAGKLADIVVLEQAIDEVGDEDFAELSVAHTIVDGELVYSASGDLRDAVANFSDHHLASTDHHLASRVGR